MPTRTDTFRRFFEAMRTGKWSTAKACVVDDGRFPGGFRGAITSGTQGSLRFQDCIDEMKRLTDAFKVGNVSKMRVSERGNAVTATYEVPVTFKNNRPFSYRGKSVKLSTRTVTLNVTSELTFNSDGKIVGMENWLNNQGAVLTQLLDS